MDTFYSFGEEVEFILFGSVVERDTDEILGRMKNEKAELARLRTDAKEEYTQLLCPKCGSQFKDLGKSYPSGLICPECPGSCKGVIYPRTYKKLITQDQWDDLKYHNRDLKEQNQELVLTVNKLSDRVVDLIDENVDLTNSNASLRYTIDTELRAFYDSPNPLEFTFPEKRIEVQADEADEESIEADPEYWQTYGEIRGDTSLYNQRVAAYPKRVE